MLEQKDEYLTHASERIITLEKRLKSGQMSGDDRVKALEAEVRLPQPGLGSESHTQRAVTIPLSSFNTGTLKLFSIISVVE